MSKRGYVEISCDWCEETVHYPTGQPIDSVARADGWIITRDGKHYDTYKCYRDAKEDELI